MRLFRLEGEQKVPAFEQECFEAYTYPNGTECVIARSSSNPVRILREIIDSLPGPFSFLYILLMDFDGRPAGRYESPVIEKTQALEFLHTFGEYIAGDARHNFWFTDRQYIQVIYDNHERIYVYGHIPSIESKLTQLGLMRGSIEEIPFPHMHSYNHELATLSDSLFSCWEWTMTPLHESDED